MVIGRNDPCYCGSGKKYKSCCMRFDFDPFLLYERSLEQVECDYLHAAQTKKVFVETLRFVKNNGWEGACHATASILYILASEIGVPCKLYIGEVYYEPAYFDHSWITIEDKIYDAAISMTLDNRMNFSPVFAGIDLKTNSECRGRYGVHHCGLGSPANQLSGIKLGTYFDAFPEKMGYGQ